MLFLSCPLCPLILLRMVQPAMAVLAVVVVADRVPCEPERFAQPCLLLDGLLDVSRVELPGADTGPIISVSTYLG